MELNYAMSYRITTLEIEQAAVRAERARMAAERAEQLVPRDGFLRRMRRRLRSDRRVLVPAAPAEASVASAAIARPSTPAEATATASVSELVPATPVEDARAGELVGCGSHAA